MADFKLKTRESKASEDKPQQNETAPSQSQTSAEQSQDFATNTSSQFHTKQDLETSWSNRFAQSNNQQQHTAMGSQDKASDSISQFGKIADNARHQSQVADLTKSNDSKPVRFSSRSKEGGMSSANNMLKIISFIAVVIAIGVGVIFFIQEALVPPADTDNTQTSTTTSSNDIERDGLFVSGDVLPDSSVGEPTAINSLYTDTELSVGSAENENVEPLIDFFSYQAYDSFTRVRWNLVGVDAGFPATEVELIDDNIQVTFSEVSTNRDGLLQPTLPIVGAIGVMEGAETTEALVFTLETAESVEYYLSLNDTGTALTLDIKTASQLEQPNRATTQTETSTTTSESTSAETTTTTTSETTSSEQSTATTSSASSSMAPGEAKLSNERSQQAQTIVSDSEEEVVMENYSFQDFGPKFEFRWEFRGEDSIPDAQAELIEEEGQFYVQVVIEDVGYDLFFGQGIQTENFEGKVNTQFSNLKAVTLSEREGTTSTYLVELGGRGDYRLSADSVSEEGRRQLIIEAFD